MMFEGFKAFLRSIGSGDVAMARQPGSDDPRIAAAALLVHLSEADGIVTPAELMILKDLLAEEFGLDLQAADRLAEAGREADHEAVDLFRFTRSLKAQLDEPARIRFVEILWTLAYADGKVHELEDNIVWRVAELLGVSARDRMLMKRQAAGPGGSSEEA